MPTFPTALSVWSVLDHGADPTGVADSLPAIQQAIDDCAEAAIPSGQWRGTTIFFPPGVYRCDGTLFVRRHVTLQGVGGLNRATELRFPANTTGLKAEHDAVTGSGRDCVIGDITLGCIAQGSTSGDGIEATTQVHLQRCHIFGFGGHGIHFVGDHNAGTNCNNSTARDCTVQGVGGRAVMVEGQDANWIKFDGVRSLECNGGGFHDSSMLGSVFVACNHEGGNGPPFSNSSDGNPRTQIIACYTESLVPSELYYPAQVLGGMGLLLSEDSNAMVINATSPRNYQVFANQSKLASSTSDAGVSFWWGGKSTEQGVAYGFGPYRQGQGPGGPQAIDFYRQKLDGSPTCPRGWFEETWANGLGPIRRSTAEAAEGGGKLWLPHGYYVGAWGYNKDIRDNVTPVRVFVTAWHTRPDLDAWAWSSRTWNVGDRVENSKPVPGDPAQGCAGWLCVAGGANDVAQWAAYGAI